MEESSSLAEFSQVSKQLCGDRFPGKIPDHRTQLILFVKAKPMVDQPQVPIGIEQDVAAFAIGVVDQQIEQGHRAQALAVVSSHVEVMIFGIVLDEQLQEPAPTGPRRR